MITDNISKGAMNYPYQSKSKKQKDKGAVLFPFKSWWTKYCELINGTMTMK